LSALGCPLWVKSGKTPAEHLLSAVPLKADMSRTSSIVSFVPKADVACLPGNVRFVCPS
jgi:hypothetical protein